MEKGENQNYILKKSLRFQLNKFCWAWQFLLYAQASTKIPFHSSHHCISSHGYIILMHRNKQIPAQKDENKPLHPHPFLAALNYADCFSLMTDIF